MLTGLFSPHPIGESLPAAYRDDFFVQQLCGGLDEVLAPIVVTLDSLPAYLDPGTAPDDVLGWIASWIGIVLDRNEPAQRQRDLIQQGIELLRWRGTARGVRDAVRVRFGYTPELVEPGGAQWSDSRADIPVLTGIPELVVRLGLPDPTAVDARRVEELVRLVKPAHISHRVELYAATE